MTSYVVVSSLFRKTTGKNNRFHFHYSVKHHYFSHFSVCSFLFYFERNDCIFNSGSLIIVISVIKLIFIILSITMKLIMQLFSIWNGGKRKKLRPNDCIISLKRTVIIKSSMITFFYFDYPQRNCIITVRINKTEREYQLLNSEERLTILTTK